MSAVVATGKAEETPQKPVLSDRKMTHQIHTAIVADTTLPYCAHIVNVQADQGKVTLQGKVHTEEEKETVGDKAAAIAGEKNVTNDILVKNSVAVAAR